MRTVAPEIFSDEFFGTLSMVERLLWMGLLLVCADDQGRMIDNSAMLRNLIFPYDDNQNISREMIEEGLKIFERAGKILRYAAGANGSGKKLIQISNWWKYQKSASWMGASKFPSPEGWIDRCRYHSGGKRIMETNWKLSGGYLPSPLPSPLLSPLPRRDNEDDLNGESESESEKEKESSSASSSLPEKEKPKKAEAEAAAETLSVLLKIFHAAGTKAGERHDLQKIIRSSIVQSGDTFEGSGIITPEDCWAMLAWAYSQNKFVKPGVIMAENILSGEHASAEWYEPSNWNVIPPEIRRSGGLVVQSEDNGLDNLSDVATRIIIKPDETVEKSDDGRQSPGQAWQSALGQLQVEMPKASFDTWVQDAVPVHYEDGLFTIAVRNNYARDWLESHLTSTVTRLLAGIMNRTVDIKFVVQEECPA